MSKSGFKHVTGSTNSISPWSANVLASATSDTDPTLLINFDNAKYVFNVTEGFSRTCIQRKVTTNKLRSVFLSRYSAETCNGMPGLLLTLNGTGLKAGTGTLKLAVNGPPGLLHYLASMRLYVQAETYQVDARECTVDTSELCYEDENLKVYSVPIEPQGDLIRRWDIPVALKRKGSTDLSPERPLKRPNSLGSTEPTPTGLLSASNSMISDLAINSEPRRPQAIGSLQNLSALLGGEGVAITSTQEPQEIPDPSRPLREDEEQQLKALLVRRLFGTPWSELKTDPDLLAIQAALNLPDNWDPNRHYQRISRHRALPQVLCYVGIGPMYRGKFDAKKATEMGVPKGRERGQLTKGESITLKDGRVITPDMCLGPSTPPTAFVVVDCPETTFIPQLTTTGAFRRILDEHNATPHFFFHRIGDGVLDDARYLAWMRSFGDQVHHIVGNRQFNLDCLTLTASAVHVRRLAALDAALFKVPKFSTQPTQKLDTVSGLPLNNHPASSQFISLRPLGKPEEQSLEIFVPDLDPFDPINDATKREEARDAFETAKEAVSAEEGSYPAQPGDDVIITSLGTGSAAPGKYRNLSCSLLQIPKWGNILLDCGEGTWGQMRRHFGANPIEEGSAYDILRRTRLIFVSHLHADHHVGLVMLLSQRRKLRPPAEPLYIIGNHGVGLYLQEYNDLEDIGIGDLSAVRLIQAENVHFDRMKYAGAAMALFKDRASASISSTAKGEGRRQHDLALLLEVMGVLNLTKLETARVDHRGVRCYGIVIGHQEGWSVVYSGDTKPCENLVEAGRGATLLIHEATMGDDEEEMAKAKTHSTVGQAIDIAKRMGARKVLLTHFSARYPKIPLGVSEYADKELVNGLEVGVAFDHLHMPLGHFWKMRHFLPALETLFKDDDLGASVMGDDVDVSGLRSDGRTSPEKMAKRASG